MGIILNTNEKGYMPFLDTPVTSFVVGLKDFCINQKYALSLKELPEAIYKIKNHHKNFYLSINLFASESEIKKFKKIIHNLKLLDIDAYIVSDLGVFNILKSNGLANKVMLDLQTYVTNKYSAKSLLDLGVKRVFLSKEITLNDIKEISLFTNGKVEVFAQGYNPITYSKRPILTNYYKNFKLKKKSDLHFIKEESRENYYFLEEYKNSLIVYNDKEYSLLPYLDELVNSGVKHFYIDAIFLDEEKIKNYIYYYKSALDSILQNNFNKYSEIKEKFIKENEFSTPFLHNQSVLLKDGEK